MATLTNPYSNPGAFGRCVIGGVLVPGVIVAIDDATKAEEWLVQRPLAGANAVTIWRGSKIADAIKIRVNLPTAQAYSDYYAIRDVLRPKPGKKPPALLIVNPTINFAGISRISCVSVDPPKPAPGLSWEAVVTLIEYGPPIPIKPGPPDPPHQETELDRAAAETQAAWAEARKA